MIVHHVANFFTLEKEKTMNTDNTHHPKDSLAGISLGREISEMVLVVQLLRSVKTRCQSDYQPDPDEEVQSNNTAESCRE